MSATPNDIATPAGAHADLRPRSSRTTRLVLLACLPALIALLASACADGGVGSGPNVNHSPVISPLGELSVTEGQRITLTPVANDSDGDPVSLSYSGWMTTSTRIATDPGTYSVTIVADDGRGGEDSLTVEIEVIADANPNRARFSLSPPELTAIPFPNDIWTVGDGSMVTNQRVNLPLPPVELPNLRAVVLDLNELDGFSLYPRVQLPLIGANPDPATIHSGSVFLLKLSEPGRGTTVDLTHRLVDDRDTNLPRIVGVPDEYLQESSSYAVVVTTALRATGDVLISRQPEMNELLHAWESGQSPSNGDAAALYDALEAIVDEGIAIDQVLTASVFTTRTVSDVPLKLRDRLDSGAVTLLPPDFDSNDTHAGFEAFATSDVNTIDVYHHRASRFSDGSTTEAFGAGTLPQQETTLPVFLTNLRTGARMEVPAVNVMGDGSIADTDITVIDPQPGDELALLVRHRVLDTTGRPHLWDGTGTIALGRVEVPSYLDSVGGIPVVKTEDPFVPTQGGSETLLLAVVTPGTAPPPGGYPVAHLIHGAESHALAPAMLHNVAVMAGQGLASVLANGPGHGGGPASSVELDTVTSGVVAIDGYGRAQDLDVDDRFGLQEPRNIVQHVADACAVVRSIQAGADIDGDLATDLSQTDAETSAFGLSAGGQVALMLAAIEGHVSSVVSNVPANIVTSWGHRPRIGEARDSYTPYFSDYQPVSLLNGSSPEWGGAYDEDIPLVGQPIQVGLINKAREIQREFDYHLWRDQVEAIATWGRPARTAELRDGPAANLLVQIARGDGIAVNPQAHLLVVSGDLEDQICVLHLEAEPAYDSWFAGLSIPAATARHIHASVAYSGSDTDTALYICHLVRDQAAQFLATGGSVIDPDPPESLLFAGDVFTFPPDKATLLPLATDPGF